MAGSSSKGGGRRSSSPFISYRKSSFSSYSSSSFISGGKSIPPPRSWSSFVVSSLANTRSITPIGGGSMDIESSVVFVHEDELIGESVDTSASGGADSISVNVRFRPLSEREFQRGDEIAWYPDGDNIVRSEYNPLMAYAFDKVFGPDTTSPEVYDVAARPVIKSAMEGINGTVFAYGVTSSGKTHTMHLIP